MSSAPCRLDLEASEENAPATSSISPSKAAALRCTAPMNAPGPPPTIPYRTFRFSGIVVFLARSGSEDCMRSEAKRKGTGNDGAEPRRLQEAVVNRVGGHRDGPR